MKCYPCGYEGKFGEIYFSGDQGNLIGRMPRTGPVPTGMLNFLPTGSVDIYVCPKCGALHSDMRGQIENEDRKS